MMPCVFGGSGATAWSVHCVRPQGSNTKPNGKHGGKSAAFLNGLIVSAMKVILNCIINGFHKQRLEFE